MTEDEKMQVAVFRFGVISDFVTGAQMSRSEKRRLMREKCARKWLIPYSEKTRISRGTIQRWVRVYKASNSNLKSLFPKDRADQGKCRAMDQETCLSLIALRSQMPALTVPQLIEQMNRQNRVTPGIVLNNSTVYRFLHEQNLMNPQLKPVDRRKFEAELPNDLWQSDVMHGPRVDVDGKMRKTYLIAIIDDHSRLIVHARFYLSEKLASYLAAFEDAIATRGLPRKLYVDNGPAFRSRHLEYIAASLAISLIHAKPYMPQGKGKIERWFKTVRTSFLTTFKGHNGLGQLNDALNRWIIESYHEKIHRATGQTPFKRFTGKMHCHRAAPANLKDYFRKVARRTVSKDRSITLNGKLYEAPVALIGKRVELLYHGSEPEKVEVKYLNESFGMIPTVNVNVNYRVKRDKNNNPQIQSEGLTKYQGGKLLSLKGENHHE